VPRSLRRVGAGRRGRHVGLDVSHVQIGRAEICDSAKGRDIANGERAVRGRKQSFSAELLQRPVDVDCGQPQHVGQMLLGQGQLETDFPFFIAAPEANAEFTKKVRYALPR
jgi:hypothetical protein